MSIIKWIEEWFSLNCNGGWEHVYNNVRIETLDNPGWLVDFNLLDTGLENKYFKKIRIDNGDNDWIFCYIEDGKFKGRGDSRKLEEILTNFKEWVEQEE
ncbi:MAG: rhodanese-related sulfurtransferase [Clostridiales bacterium]|nr:rhodanese-related sulfurtransferase [Clostridiales bacterium]